MPTIPWAVQLYTLRAQTAKDFAATVAQVAGIGYRGVELAGLGNLQSPQQAKRVLDDAGLRIVGAHVGIEQLESDLNRVLDEQHALNNSTIIVPWMPEERRRGAAGWKRAAYGLNQLGAGLRERGFELCYHHHSFEFQRVEGCTGMDVLLQHTEPALVKFELDTYWLKDGGEDPARFITRVAGRAPLVHLKDMSADSPPRFAPVGAGILDFKSILIALKQSGARWGIVEQDDCYDTPPLEAIRCSLEYLREISSQ